jgi:hypothetical protein
MQALCSVVAPSPSVSKVGMNWNGVKELTLGTGCIHEGTIMHEMLHSLGNYNGVVYLFQNISKISQTIESLILGFWHEQSRPDRDNYVNVLYANVQPGNAMHRERKHVDHMLSINRRSLHPLVVPMGFPYDYNSLLHYGTDYFTVNGKPTLVPKDSSAKIGQRNVLSATDILEVRRYYQCVGPNVA